MREDSKQQITGLVAPGIQEAPTIHNKIGLADPGSRALDRIVEAIDRLNISVMRPGCHLKKSAAQSITTATYTAATFDVESFDTDNMHDNVTNPSRITINTAGVYLFTGSTVWATNTTGHRIMGFRTNASGTQTLGGIVTASIPVAAAPADLGRNSISMIYKLGKGEFVEMMVYQNSGAGLNLVASSSGIETHFACHYLGVG